MDEVEHLRREIAKMESDLKKLVQGMAAAGIELETLRARLAAALAAAADVTVH